MTTQKIINDELRVKIFKALAEEAKLIKVRKEAQAKYMSIDLEAFQTYLPGFLDTL
ncbi:hypothetical protein P4H71_09405 [Paenibacillus kribbensis]|nr:MULTISPECIES: hypothetical protein [Paenibacillus]MEC0234541.1 hypothetical protein [Paenibacillus kribbensis]